MAENACDHIFLLQERINADKLVIGDAYMLPDAEAVAADKLFLHGAFADCRGQASLRQLGQGDFVRHADDRDALYAVFKQQVPADLIGALDRFDAGDGAQRLQIRLIHQHRRDDLEVPEPVARIVIRGTLPQGRSGVGDAKVRRNGDHGDHHDRDVRHDLFFYVAACVQDLRCFHVLPVYHLCKIDSCFFSGFIPHRIDADKELAHHGHQQIASLR